jgi:hypothetical protein
MVSAISPKGSLRFMVVRGGVIRRISQEVNAWPATCGFPDRGWSSCSSLQKREELRRFTQWKLKLFFLPPYSPELNPDEFVWNDVKNNGVGRALVHGPLDLHRAAIGRLRYLQKSPKIVRSFFQAPDTCYSAAA